MKVPNTHGILKIFPYFPGFYVSIGTNTKHRIHQLEG